MALTVLLAEPDPATARNQEAALRELEDLELEVQVFGGNDAMEEVERVRPDILVLRHERSGQTGFAILSRLRKHHTARNLPVLLTTSDASKEALERHRSSPARADHYLMLPVSRADLEEAIRSLSERARSNKALVEAAGGGPLEPPKLRRASSNAMPWIQSSVADVAMPVPVPPPAPPRTSSSDLPSAQDLDAGVDALDAPAPPMAPLGESTLEASLPRPGQPSNRGPAPSMDPTDVAFVERLFGGINTSVSDARMETLVPTNTTGSEAMDSRTQFLRDKLRERERDLQRLARLWRAKEGEIQGHEARVAQKESEVESYLTQMNELTREVQRLQGALADKERELGQSMEGMLTERVMMEKDLIEVVAAKEKELFALKRERSELQSAAESMKQQLVARIYEWEAAYRDLDARLQRTVAHGAGILGDVYQRLDDTRVLLGQARAALKDTQLRALSQQLRATEEAAANKELQQAIHHSREKLLARIRDLSARSRMLARMYKSAEKTWAAALTQAEVETHAMDQARRVWHARLRAVEAWLTTAIQRRDEEIARLRALHGHEVEQRRALTVMLARETQAAEELIHHLETELNHARSEGAALHHLRAEDRVAAQDTQGMLRTQLERLSDGLRARDLKLEEAKDTQETLQGENRRVAEAGEAAVREREMRINELEKRLVEETGKLAHANEKRAGLEKGVSTRDITIKDLSDKLDGALETQAGLESTLASVQAETRALQLKLEDRERAVAHRDQQLAAAKNDVRISREEVERLTAEIQTQEETIRVKTLEARNLDQSVQRKAQELEEMEASRVALQQQLARGEESYAEQRRKMLEERNNVAARDKEIARLNGEVQRHTEENGLLKRQLEDRQAALEQAEQTLFKVEDDNRQAAARERTLQAAVEGERLETGRARQEIGIRDAALAEARSAVTQAQRELGETLAQVQVLTVDLAARDAQLERGQRDVEAARLLVREKEQELEARAAEMARLESRGQGLAAELEAERKTLAQRHAEREEARAALVAANAQLDEARAASRELSTQVASLKGLVAAAQDAQSQLAGVSGESARALSKTQAEIQRLTDALAARDAALKGLEARLREREEYSRARETELEGVQRQLAETSMLVADLQRVQTDAERTQGSTASTLETLRGEKDALAQQLFAVQQELRGTQSQVTATSEQLRISRGVELQLREQATAAVTAAESNAREALERAGRLRDELAAMRAARDEATLTVDALTQRVRTLEEATHESVRERTTVTAREAALSKQLGEARARVGQLEAAQAEANLHRADLEETITRLTGQVDALANAKGAESELRLRTMEERTRAEKERNDLTNDLEQTRKKLEDRVHDLERLNLRLEQESAQRAALEASVVELKESLGGLETDGATRLREREELERARTQVAARAQQLEKRIQEMTAQLLGQERAGQDQMAELQARLETQTQMAANERDELKRRLADAEAARGRSEAAVRQAQDEKENLRRQALRRLQEYDAKLKDAEARAASVAQATSAASSSSKELELARAESTKAKAERDALKKEAIQKMGILQGRVEKLQRVLAEAGIALPNETVPPPANAPLPRPPGIPTGSHPALMGEGEGSPTVVTVNPFMQDQAKEPKP